ncbi:XRE family transcriptional regulator [Selenomonas sp.]|uniref:XRE family transcriptional regulator n=1 Tax=Selenomonas sp. TaxID=2053611 RepID=UPI003FA29E84
MLTLNDYLEEQLKDPVFKREYDALEGWYQEQLARQDAPAHTEKSAASKAPHPPRKSRTVIPV